MRGSGFRADSLSVQEIKEVEMNLGLAGKRVLVTGSTRGIGLAIARAFLQEGARVAVSSRDEVKVRDVAKTLAASYVSNSVLAIRCDFRISGDVAVMRDEILREWKGLDILVANVGCGRSVSDPIPSLGHFEEVFSQNFSVAVNAAREFLPLLEATGGNVVFISSVAGMEAFGAPVDYSVAKTAVISFSKNVSRKVAGRGVRVNCIAPGNVYFEGGSWEEKMKGDPGAVNRLIESTVPMKRFGTPDEIADAVLFVSSERASFITGAVLSVDGGQTVTIF